MGKHFILACLVALVGLHVAHSVDVKSAKPVPLVTHYISNFHMKNKKCFDEPGWKSNSLMGSADCAYVRQKGYCKDGIYWRHKGFFHRYNTWPKNEEGTSMMTACCQCGGGTLKGKGNFKQRVQVYKRKAEQVGKKLQEQKVKWNKAKKSLENHFINGKLCFDLPGWSAKWIGGCNDIKKKNYCRDGSYNRRRAYFHIRSSYPKNDEGVNMLQACCHCGGGTLRKDSVNTILKKHLKKGKVPERVRSQRTLAGFL